MTPNPSAETILAVPVDQPEKLFDKGRYEDQWRTLMKTWHPDSSRHPRAAEVSQHLNALKSAAKKKITSGIWSEFGKLILTGKDHKTRTILWKKHHAFELGDFYYGDSNVTYVVAREHAGLADNAVKKIATLHFADAGMAGSFAPLLPQMRANFETSDGRRVLVLSKQPGSYTIRDVMETFSSGVLPPEAAAWILSSVYNLACYLEWARVCHQDISLDTVFISPEKHAAFLYGGWWYSAEVGEELKFLPTRTHNLASHLALAQKRADQGTDLLLVKALGREMVGLLPGGGTKAPPAMADFLRHPPTGLAVEDYKLWRDETLPAAFGARRFVELKVSEADVFKP